MSPTGAETIWDRLEARRVPDEVIGEAYEAAGALARSLIKRDIAAAHAAFANALPSSREETLVAYDGMELRRTTRPADWCLVFYEENGAGLEGRRKADDADLAAARRCVLAAVCAVFSGVEEVWAIGVTKQASPANGFAYAGFDLAGVENVCQTGLDEIPDLFDLLRKERGVRILLMGDPPWRGAAFALAGAARDVGVWCEGGESEARQTSSADGNGGWEVLAPILPPSFFCRREFLYRENL